MNAVGGNVGLMGRGNVPLGLRFLLISIVSASLMLLDHREEHLARIRQALSLVVYPIQVGVDLPFAGWRLASRALTDQSALLEENSQLRSERLAVDVRLQRLAALEAENDRLRAMLDSSARVSDRVLGVEILAVDLDPYRQRFTINRGLNDGVYIGQALLDAEGVVGQIVHVDLMTSEVVLISDADHALPVAINRNGLRTIVVGTGDSSRLRLPYLTNSADIEPGDLLLSSGLGGIFPSGYPVGRVLEVRRRPGQSFAEVIAEPAALLDRDREVLLVWTADDAAEVRGATSVAEAP
jgi:rod shape-determining protein MreC